MAIVLWSDDNFNPLRREGGDISSYTLVGLTLNFNPLRREGGDGHGNQILMGGYISIHSAARAETMMS